MLNQHLLASEIVLLYLFVTQFVGWILGLVLCFCRTTHSLLCLSCVYLFAMWKRLILRSCFFGDNARCFFKITFNKNLMVSLPIEKTIPWHSPLHCQASVLIFTWMLKFCFKFFYMVLNWSSFYCVLRLLKYNFIKVCKGKQKINYYFIKMRLKMLLYQYFNSPIKA